MTEIKLEVGQTWLDSRGGNRTIRLIENDDVCYVSIHGDLDVCSVEYFRNNFAIKLAPKTVRKSQCVVKFSESHHSEDFIGFFASEKEAKDFCQHRGYVFIMWPLVVNGVEQWIEVNCD